MRNSFTRRSLFSGAAFALVFALLSGFPANLNKNTNATTSLVVAPPMTLAYVDFIDAAYLGALGRYPTCEESQAAWDQLASAANSNDLLGGAKRFVATLFETQDSYDSGTLYEQTSEYEARNAHNSGNGEGFVTDLYHAFLQRNPDESGFNFWVGQLSNGRKAVLQAFIVCGEFEDLVGTLTAGSRPNCAPCGGMTCDPGSTLDANNCICVPNCEGPNNGHYNELCQ